MRGAGSDKLRCEAARVLAAVCSQPALATRAHGAGASAAVATFLVRCKDEPAEVEAACIAVTKLAVLPAARETLIRGSVLECLVHAQRVLMADGSVMTISCEALVRNWSESAAASVVLGQQPVPRAILSVLWH